MKYQPLPRFWLIRKEVRNVELLTFNNPQEMLERLKEMKYDRCKAKSHIAADLEDLIEYTEELMDGLRP